MPPLRDPSLKKSCPDQGYWRTLAEQADSPEFHALCRDEFPAGAQDPSQFSRRSFMKLLGASAALAGMQGCRWPKETIVPQASRPEGVDPGKTRRFATAMELGGVAAGLLVTSYDGRPIKVEGNAAHPINGGAADVLSQASILELYDPDRSRAPFERRDGVEQRRTWADFDAWAGEKSAAFAETGGEGLAVLSEASSSPVLAAQKARFLARFPRATWHEYEAIGEDNRLAGSRIACGRPLRSVFHLDRTRCALALDSDLLDGHPAVLKHARDFAAARDPEGRMSRLYAVESAYSLTGAAADHRLALPTARVASFALTLAARILKQLGARLPSEYRDLDERLKAHRRHDFPEDFVLALVEDLLADPRGSLIVVGERQPPVVHALGTMLNILLGSEALEFVEPPAAVAAGGVESLGELAGAMDSGSVDCLLILGGNPVYDAPADLDFAALLGKVPDSAHLGLHANETAELCRWHLPRAHFLESWDAARAWDGTLCGVQPLIEPLYGGRTPAELIALWSEGRPRSAHELAREAVMPLLAGGGERAWRRFLHDGVLADSAAEPRRPRLQQAAITGAIGGFEREPASAGLTIEFLRDASLHDGRFANNGWLQELPDAISRLTWDNAAFVSVQMARKRNIATGDMLRLRVGQRELEAPACIMPGQAPETVIVHLGYGRRTGAVGADVGFDAYRLRTTRALHFSGRLEIAKTGRRHEFASVQDHHLIDRVGADERERRAGVLVREADLKSYREDPEGIHGHGHHPALLSLWDEFPYEGHRWGMSIDLNACVGCNACVVACQAENNIPVVGKDEVARGREMHWIRMDRYFKGDPEDPAMVHQPVACTHCELAPCEQVCPVGATVHSDEGLNDMVYNRCVGTRYCANNCPYKVRRFNFFNYTKTSDEVQKLARNPEVTVRSRGVMEKCTYCVQRIQAVKIEAKNEGRPIADGEITPACAQTCPSKAIRFGDLNDEKSAVRAKQGDHRAYAMLSELNIKPRTVYLARIKNPNPRLAGAEDHGHREH